MLAQAAAQQRAAADVRRWSASASVVSWVVAIAPVRYSVYSLYWYKSANADTRARRLLAGLWPSRLLGTQSTRFTGTKVQMLTPEELLLGARFTCFTSTKVQILTPEERLSDARTPRCVHCR